MHTGGEVSDAQALQAAFNRAANVGGAAVYTAPAGVGITQDAEFVGHEEFAAAAREANQLFIGEGAVDVGGALRWVPRQARSLPTPAGREPSR